MRKATVKFQLVRDGELYATLYDRFYDARLAGEQLVDCGWIKIFSIIPIKTIWVSC